jgi:hypothetical protein
VILDYINTELLEDLSRRRRKTTAIDADVFYLTPSATKPVVRYGVEPRGETAAVFEPRRVRIDDARQIHPTLDREGFALVSHASAVRDFGDEREIERIGHTEAADLVAKANGATHVHVFDHTLRRHSPDAQRQPSVRVHNDYTGASARRRVRELLGDLAASQPFAFINVWRPIHQPAVDRPLALCDARTVAPEDLIATELVYPDRRGEIYSVTYNPQHRWFYVPDMATDEAILIKCADTREGVAQFTPHTSVDNPLAAPHAPPRESIEFRTIAFFSEKRPVNIGRLR